MWYFRVGHGKRIKLPGSAVARRNARVAFRLVVIDNLAPGHIGQIARLRHVLNELAEVWGIE